MERVVMLTTTDNPYNPFTQYDSWAAYDRQMGYYTPEYLARIAKTSSILSDAQNDAIVEDAINEIVALNILGIYKKVIWPDSYKNEENLEDSGKSA